MINTGLKNKVVLVTGASHGIGAATAIAFANQGAAVFITYLRIPFDESDVNSSDIDKPGEVYYRLQQSRDAKDVVQGIQRNGGKADAWEADLSDVDVIPHLFDRAEEAFGSVDVLVNNAAHFEADTFIPQTQISESDQRGHVFIEKTISTDLHDQHFAVNSRAVALMMAEYTRRHVARDAQWGRIINISTDGASAFSRSVSYGASKHALESYSRAAAKEIGKYGITVNIVSPGPVQTGYIPPHLEAELVEAIPLGRIGQPDEIADVIVFLASEQARWLTGQLIYVGGGHAMPL
jgi:3-oxoacyl-[acyl-carrier protein] reductase